MQSFNHLAFGAAVTSIKREVDQIARDAHMARVYVDDTAESMGQADYDLLYAAKCLELAARDLRLLHARLQEMRGEPKNPATIPVLTFGHSA